MNNFRFFISILIFVLIFSALALAQTEKAQTLVGNKIAIIDSEAFDNKETGIKEIIEAYDKIEIEFKLQAEELNSMIEQIIKQNKELVEFSSKFEEYCKVECSPEILNKKISEYDLLVSKYKKRQDEVKSLYEKRKSDTLANASSKIGAALKQFAKEKGYAIIIDSSKGNSYLIEGETFEITKEFIQFYNENFAKTKTQL